MKKEVNNETLISLVIKESIIREPNLYQVVLHNDDFTPMEFVVEYFGGIFLISDRRKATGIMMEAHLKGKSICGIYSKDIAESKITLAVDYAKKNEHPLICSMEVAGQ